MASLVALVPMTHRPCRIIGSSALLALATLSSIVGHTSSNGFDRHIGLIEGHIGLVRLIGFVGLIGLTGLDDLIGPIGFNSLIGHIGIIGLVGHIDLISHLGLVGLIEIVELISLIDFGIISLIDISGQTDLISPLALLAHQLVSQPRQPCNLIGMGQPCNLAAVVSQQQKISWQLKQAAAALEITVATSANKVANVTISYYCIVS
jgi:hypothetical protein